MFAVMCFCQTAGAASDNPPKVTEEEALAIAERIAPDYGYDTFDMDVEILSNITPWEKRFPKLEFFDQPKYTDIEKKLEGRRYWTVNCLPTFPRYGGSFCVFVDADTGEVVHVFTGW